MTTLNIPIILMKIEKISLNYLHLPSDLELRLTLSGSKYPCLEQFMHFKIIRVYLRSKRAWGNQSYSMYILCRQKSSCAVQLGSSVFPLPAMRSIGCTYIKTNSTDTDHTCSTDFFLFFYLHTILRG